jgi:UDP:flavonoid glycosyltransferase YjiC (YdhE family)
MSQIILMTKGTGGDLYPMSRVGKALKCLGYDVLFLTHWNYDHHIRQAGLSFVPLDSPKQTTQMTWERALLGMTNDEIRLQKSLLSFALTEYQILKRRLNQTALVIANYNSFTSAQMISEEMQLPLVVFHTAPSLMPTHLFEAPFFEELYGILGSEINRIRAAVRLPEVRNWRSWLIAADAHIGIWPEWFAGHEPGWPENMFTPGFLHNEDIEKGELDDEIRRFLEDADAPVLITHGTSLPTKREFFTESVKACHMLGKKALLVAPFEEVVPARLPPNIKWVRSAPFGVLMPRMNIIIHHGGIGVTGQALASGAAQLALAYGYDRPDNAKRIERLGAGHYLPPRYWTAENIAAEVDALSLASSQLTCRKFARRMARQGTNAIDEAATVIEQVISGKLKRSVARDDFEENAPIQQNLVEISSPRDSQIPDVILTLSADQRALLLHKLYKSKGRECAEQATRMRTPGAR